MRIASLIPSGTDIAVSLGLLNNLVGRSQACDHRAARNLLPPNLPPAEIDAAVREEFVKVLFACERLLTFCRPDTCAP